MTEPCPTMAALVANPFTLSDLAAHVEGCPRCQAIMRGVTPTVAAALGAWPEPTTEPPDVDTLEEWDARGGCEATDGCWVEIDGICPHGHPSWLVYEGIF